MVCDVHYVSNDNNEQDLDGYFDILCSRICTLTRFRHGINASFAPREDVSPRTYTSSPRHGKLQPEGVSIVSGSESEQFVPHQNLPND